MYQIDALPAATPTQLRIEFMENTERRVDWPPFPSLGFHRGRLAFLTQFTRFEKCPPTLEREEVVRHVTSNEHPASIGYMTPDTMVIRKHLTIDPFDTLVALADGATP